MASASSRLAFDRCLITSDAYSLGNLQMDIAVVVYRHYCALGIMRYTHAFLLDRLAITLHVVKYREDILHLNRERIVR